MRRVLVGVVAVGVAAVGLLAGCAAPGVVGAATAVPIGEQPYAGPFSGADSPLVRALSTGDPAVDVAQLQADDAAVQAAVVACMAARGFTYLPQVQDASAYTSSLTLDADPGYPDLTRQQFAETYGFGISTDVPYPDVASAQAVEVEDPNAATYEALDDAGRAAWDAALYGPDPEVDPSVDGTGAVVGSGSAALPDDQRGCYDLAYDPSIPAATADAELDPALAAAEAALVTLQQEVADDARVRRAVDDYTVCMRAAGWDVRVDEGSDLSWAAWGDASDRFAAAGGDDVLAAMTDDEYDALTDDERGALEDAAAPDPATLAALQAQEVDEAVADLRCLGPSEPAVTAVRAELENAFIATHGPELELLRRSSGG